MEHRMLLTKHPVSIKKHPVLLGRDQRVPARGSAAVAIFTTT